MTHQVQAVRENNLECVRYLIENGAIVGVLNSKDKTVYDIARGLRKKFREPMLQLLDSAKKASSPLEEVPVPGRIPNYYLFSFDRSIKYIESYRPTSVIGKSL
jgi:hypothetical protein